MIHVTQEVCESQASTAPFLIGYAALQVFDDGSKLVFTVAASDELFPNPVLADWEWEVYAGEFSVQFVECLYFVVGRHGLVVV